MILRKDPFIKKLMGILLLALVSMSFLLLLSNYYFLKQMNMREVFVKEFILRNIGMMFFMVMFHGILFRYLVNSFVNKLEKISFFIDRTMDGDYSVILNFDEEGILSRLESQFYQMMKRLKLSLESLHDEKENIKALVTDISHQIKTPLASIKMFNDLLMEEQLDLQEEKEFLNQEKEEIKKLEWLSDGLIKISRMEVGIIELKKENRDIKKTIIEAVNGVYLKGLEKNIDIHIDLVSIMIHHDYKWTKEAIFNVLENAIKYTPKNGQVCITMEKLETYIKIDIVDNGIGIPREEIHTIFNRFYRGKAEVVQKSDGLGIGLYLTRKILEEQGGSIIAFSRKDEGTKFSIILTLQNCKKG